MEISTKAEFLSDLKTRSGVSFSLVLFYQTEQPQSKQMLDVAEALHRDYQFNYYRVQLDTQALEVCSDWQPTKVSKSPSVVIFQGDVEVAKVEGADPAQLVAEVERVCKKQDVHNGRKTEDVLQNRLQMLVNSSPVMIFMKGRKQDPFCRFSKQAVFILNSMGVEFNSFDVLSDESVREGLKVGAIVCLVCESVSLCVCICQVFSKWPTFPQLYVSPGLEKQANYTETSK